MFDFDLTELSVLDDLDLGGLTSEEPQRVENSRIFPILINMDFTIFNGHKLSLPLYMYLCSETEFIKEEDKIKDILLERYHIYKAPKGFYKKISQELLSMDARKTKDGEEAHPKTADLKAALKYLEEKGLVQVIYNSHPNGKLKTTIDCIYIKKLENKEQKKRMAKNKGIDNIFIQGDRGIMLDNRIIKALIRTFRADSLKVFLYIFSKKAWVQKTNKKDTNFYVNASNILKDVYGIEESSQTRSQLVKVYTILSDLKTLGFIKVDTEVKKEKIKTKEDVLFYSYFKIWGVKYLTYDK